MRFTYNRYTITNGLKNVKTRTAVIITAVVMILGAGSGLSFLLVGSANAVAQSNNPVSCGNGKLIVNVTYGLYNDYDSGVAGNAWANDTVNRHLQVFQLGTNNYCATVNDTGSFVTFNGVSPGGHAVVSSGVDGVINGGYTTTTFTGTQNTGVNYASMGNLGNFNLECTDAYNCPGEHPSFLNYVSPTSGYDLATWGWTYHTAKNGNWVNSATGNIGDISQ